MNFNICHRYQKAFTLMEMLISMVVISILMAASVPMLTQFSTSKTGTDKNTLKCINENNSTGWYNTDGAGATTTPTTGTACYSAVMDAKYNRGAVITTLTWNANNGTSPQKIMAKKILRAACDLGGEKACDFFIENCWKNGTTSSPYCDDTSDYTDITYYLHLNRTTYTNVGASYIAAQLTSLLPKMNSRLLNETIYDATSNPNSNNNLAYDLAKPWVYILGCNNGIASACTTAYNNNYNKSCYQIRNNWSAAPTQYYNLTYSNSGTAYENIYCDMTSLASASIKGCNQITSNLLLNRPNDDCSIGWTNSYNRTCNLVANFWPQSPAGTYNLTWNGAPPTALVSTECPIATPECVAQGMGSVCADGTVYAGDYQGHHYYTTTDDQGAFAWATSPNLAYTYASDINDGEANTSRLESLVGTDTHAPYKAAQACYNSTDNDLSDWYLPARNEYQILYNNRVAIGNFNTSNQIYWSSTEHTADAADYIDFSRGSWFWWYGSKWNTSNVRCIRKLSTQDDTCLNIGDSCSNGTKYAGVMTSVTPNYYIYTTTTDKGLFLWNNGTTNYVFSGAVDAYYGLPNTERLATLSDICSPYNAALACKYLSNTSTNGHNDWFLASYNELSNVVLANRVAIGNIASSNYWTSTESSSDPSIVSCSYMSGSSYGMTTCGKTITARVRCIRRD